MLKRAPRIATISSNGTSASPGEVLFGMRPAVARGRTGTLRRSAHLFANCKIAYTQKLREGVASAATFTYAGFWIRFVAVLLDGVILFVASVIVQLALRADGAERAPGDDVDGAWGSSI
jgi:hypothetical protein